MTEITVQMDDEELAEAQELFGTKTPEETVRVSLRRAVTAQRRQVALEREFGPERAEQYSELRDIDK